METTAIATVYGALQVGMKTSSSVLANPSPPGENEPEFLLYNYADLPKALEFFATR